MEDFAPDCAACAALCCLALAFDKGEMFGHDKAAGTPCHHLSGHLCTIHADLGEKGYRGCASFDCLGAGQRVSALFDGSWRDEPARIPAMISAFRAMRDIQELRQMLVAARGLTLPPETVADLDRWQADLAAARETREALAAFDPRPLRRWLRDLARHVPR